MTPTESGAQRLRIILVLSAILTALALVTPAAAQSRHGEGKISPEVERHLRAAGADEMLPLIIQTAGEPDDAHLARLRGRGGLLKWRYEGLSGYSASLPASRVEEIAALPEVARVSFDSPVRAHLDIAYPAVKADIAYKDFGLSGSGVGVAVVDTGVYLHPDLQRGLLSPQPFEIDIVGAAAGPGDAFGHGTHVAGIINGNASQSSGLLAYRTFRGIAPGARLISIRALSPDGTGYTSDVIAGINWAIKNTKNYNIRVINLSLGHPVYESFSTDPLCKAVFAAYKAGIVVVVAGGNDGGVGTGFGTIDSPGDEPSAITVGSVDDARTVTTTDDVLSGYSSKGPSLVDFVVKPDLVAPGTSIVSLRDPGSYLDVNFHQFVLKVGDYTTALLNGSSDGVYYILSGTSIAAPFVSGAAALMLQKSPGLNPATVKARLMASSVKDNHLMFETGAGELDVDAALKATGTASSAMSPLSMLGSDGYVYVQNTGSIWGGAWTLPAVYGAAKGGADGIVMSDVPPSMLSVFCAVWGGDGSAGRAGSNAVIWNNTVTASGQIFSGEACTLTMTTGTVNNGSAVWGGGGK